MEELQPDLLHHRLIRRIALGQETALKELYDLFKARVFNTALGYVQDTSDAEEITQDVFVKIYQSSGRFEAKSAVNTWIYRITVNLALDRISHRKRHKRAGTVLSLFRKDHTAAVELPHFDHPGILLEKKEHARLLFKALESLPAQQKTAFILSFMEDLPRREVADIMELSLKAVESLLQRAKINLRQILEEFAPPRRNPGK